MLTRARTGVTLVELLVTLTLGAIVLSLVTVVCLRQQRIFADLANATALAGQLRDAAAILPIDLRPVASGSGDIRDARDTSLEIRGTIASAVVCDTLRGGVVLAPKVAGVESYAGMVTALDVGDSLWLFAATDTIDVWRAFRITAVSGAPAGACGAVAPVLDPSSRSVPRVAVTLDSTALAGWIGAPLRVTRALRYSLYRAADGGWYLGERDWNSALARFNTIQPVSGPFLPPSPSDGGLTFRYLDSAGAALGSPVTNPARVALVRVDLRGKTKQSPRAVSASATIDHFDSVSAVVLLRNRR